MHRQVFAAFLALSAALPPCVRAGDLAGGRTDAVMVVAPEMNTWNASSPWFVPQRALPARSSRQDLELGWVIGGFNVKGTLRHQWQQGSAPGQQGILNQLYYDGAAANGLAWSAGKKLLSWGVGYGFRPLDVVQREDRRRADAPALAGVPLLALEWFDRSDALTLAWTRPGGGRGDGDFTDESLALHAYRLTEAGNDLHGVLRLSRRHGLEAGLGTTLVVGTSWSFHGSLLLEQRHPVILNSLAGAASPLSTSDPMTETSRSGGMKALAGMQWTGASGWSLLLEAWLDGEAWRRSDWQALDALTARQRALAGLVPETALAGNLAWSSQAFQAPNLLQQNLLLRVSRNDGDGCNAYGELLRMPEDGGWVATLGASLEADRQKLSFGLRQLGGSSDSVAGRAPIHRTAWLEWRWALY